MGPSRGVIERGLRRVGESAIGEIVGRGVNLALPFVVLSMNSATLATDVLFLALAVAFMFNGTLANVVASIHVLDFAKSVNRRSMQAFLPWVAAAGLMSGVATVMLVPPELGWSAALVTAFSVTISASAGLLAAPATAALNSDHRYMAPGLTWSFRLVPLIGYAAASPAIPALHLLLAGIAVTDSFRTAVLLRLASYRLALRDGHPLTFPAEALHLVAGSIVAGLTPLAARWLASLGDPGGVSIFEAADRLHSAMASLAVIGFGNVVLVYLARLSGTADEHQTWRWILLVGIVWSLIWMVAATLIWALLPDVLAALPRQTTQTLAEMRNVFLALSTGLPAFIISVVFSRRMLTTGLTRRLLPMALAGFAFTSASGWLLSQSLGIIGIAFAVSAGQYLVMLLMAHALFGRLGHAYSRPR